jgi:hypothetical protein
MPKDLPLALPINSVELKYSFLKGKRQDFLQEYLVGKTVWPKVAPRPRNAMRDSLLLATHGDDPRHHPVPLTQMRSASGLGFA